MPVPAFGAISARLLIVGLAPGKHGANASGRPFTGDASGTLLFQTLHEFGYSSLSRSTSVDDNLQLNDCRITNAVKCLPPQNKPSSEEINQCNHYLTDEIRAMPHKSVILALGQVAHKAVCKALGLKTGQYRFFHAAEYQLSNDRVLIDSYHCSRYNIQTRRLTPAMFQQVFLRIQKVLAHE